MSNRRCIAVIGLVAVTLLLGCASSNAPGDWLPSAKEARSNVYGSWMKIGYIIQDNETRSEGEFIAVSGDSVYYLFRDYGRVVFRAVDRAAVTKAQLFVYDSEYGILAEWTGAGVASCLSHGIGLVFSVPVWILGGTLSAVARSHEPIIEINTDEDWEAARKFARFPMGLPPNLDRDKLTITTNTMPWFSFLFP
jgi:hypothetical protein